MNYNILTLVPLKAQIIKHRSYKVASLPLLLYSFLSSFLNIYICSLDINIAFATPYTGRKIVFLGQGKEWKLHKATQTSSCNVKQFWPFMAEEKEERKKGMCIFIIAVKVYRNTGSQEPSQ